VVTSIEPYWGGLFESKPGRSPSLKNAKRNARIKWRRGVRVYVGPAWANWDWALKDETTCPESPGYCYWKKWWGWSCTARATPAIEKES
jgi:hypothetical protein